MVLASPTGVRSRVVVEMMSVLARLASKSAAMLVPPRGHDMDTVSVIFRVPSLV